MFVMFRCSEEQQLAVDHLSSLDTPQHSATLLSMLRLAQQLAVAEAVQQQLQQQQWEGAAKDKPAAAAALVGQPTLASLQPPALVLLRIMRKSAAAAAAAGQQQQQQQQQQVPLQMLQQLKLLQREQLNQRIGKHFMLGPVSTCIQVGRSG
jgi:hypothetical protein